MWKNPKDSTKKLLQLVNKFGKFAGNKIYIQKSIVLIYKSNKLTEKFRKQSHFQSQCIRKNKTPKYKFNQGGKRPVF